MKKLCLVFMGTLASYLGLTQVVNPNLQEAETINEKPKFNNTDDLIIHPQVIPMVYLGETPNLRDVPPLDKNNLPPAKVKGERDWPKNKIVNPNALPQGLDPALQMTYPAPAINKALTYNWEGLNSGAAPHDPSMDVGPNHVIQMINGSGGSSVRIWDKTGTPLIATTNMAALCGTPVGGGDPIVIYDEIADRWILTEFNNPFNGSADELYIAVSTTADPTGSYYTYQVTSPSGFADYPKYSIWEDAYICTANLGSNDIFAMDRNSMLTGGAASAQYFTQPNFGTIGFQAGTPVSLNGTTLPPAGTPAMIMRMRDDAWAGASSDALEIWDLNIDWATPGNSTLSQQTVLPISPYDSDLCGYTTFSCMPQPGTAQEIDPLREVLMNRIHYRNFGSHESIVCCHVTDVDGTDHAGVRWYELRRTGGAGGSWTIYQEGTYAPDSDNRFMGSICISQSGNIGLMFNISSSSTYPSIRYTGRKECDPLNQMTEPETVIMNGSGVQGVDRYGDYNQMGLDPSDGETFYGTAMYNAAGTNQMRTRIAAFNIDQCILAPEVSFDSGTYTVDEPNTTASASACLDYQILNVPVSIAMAPTQNADVTVNVIGGTATQGEDFTLNNTTFTLNGSNLTEIVEVWVYNDAIVEGAETIQLGYTLNSNGGDAVAGSSNQTCDITINDDDIDPASMLGPLVTVMTEDFESGLGTFTSNNNAGGPQNLPWQTNNAAGASSAFWTVPGTNATQIAFVNDDDCDCNMNSVDLISQSLDLSGYVAATLTFDSYYENGNYNGDQEVATVLVSVNGGAASVVYTLGAGGAWQNETVDLTPYVGNNDVVITFNYSDGTGWLYGWAVDNINVTGNGPPVIQTAINTGSGMTADLGPNQTVHFYDPATDNVMMTLENTSSFDYGCVTVEVDGDGTAPTAVEFNSANVADFIHSKTYTVVPENTNPSGTYNVTLYYEEAEVAAWEAATGNSRNNAEIIKVAGANSMNDVTPANQGSYTITNSAATLGAFYTDVTFTASFSTGFSGFGVGIYNPGNNPPVADFAASSTSVCVGEQVDFTDNSTNGPTSWAWDFGDGNTSTAQNPSNTYAGAGSYTVTLDVTNAYGTDTYTQSITVNALPNVSASATSTSICEGSSTTLNASGASTYDWDNGAGSGASVTVTPTGTTTYTVTGTDANGCVNTDAVIVTVNPLPTISVSGSSNPSACLASDGSVTIGASGSGDLSWTGTASGNANGVSLPYTVTGLAAGTYMFTFVDVNGCTSNMVTEVITDPNAPSAPVVTPGNTVDLCQGESATLTSSYATGNTWSTAETTQSIVVSTAGNYTVYYTDGNGCVSNSTSVTVNVNPNPTVTASSDQTTCEGTAVTISASGASTYAWDNGAGSGSSVSVNPSSTTVYTVTGTDVNGCEGTDQVTVTVNPLPSVSMSTPQDSLCDYNSPVTLVGTPAGGMFSGAGVAGSTFDPSVAGIGTHTITYSYTDGNGCSNTATVSIYVDACMGVPETELEGVSLFPDPNDGKFVITGLEVGTWFKIYDERGRIILDSKIESEKEEIILPVVESGVYYLKATQNGKEAGLRFLIAK